jgi:hypothetical protein
MTRDEARFKLLEATESRCTESFITDFLDSVVALGLLKLDEPKSEEDTLAEIFRGYVAMSPHYFRIRLDELGLKIVSN